MKSDRKNQLDYKLFLSPYLLKCVEAVKIGAFKVEDDYDKFRKRKCIEALSRHNFRNKEVLEIGTFSGEYLKFISKRLPKELYGITLFKELMPQINGYLKGTNADIATFDGKIFPFPNVSFDIVFTCSFLQQYADSKKMKSVIHEMARVSREKVILIEDFSPEYIKTEFYRAREPRFFKEFFEEKGFTLKQFSFLNTSNYGALQQLIRSNFNPPGLREEGAPLNPQGKKVQSYLAPLGSLLDSFLGSKKGLAIMAFERRTDQFTV